MSTDDFIRGQMQSDGLDPDTDEWVHVFPDIELTGPVKERAQIERLQQYAAALETIIRRAGVTIGACGTEETIEAVRSMYRVHDDLPDQTVQES